MPDQPQDSSAGQPPGAAARLHDAGKMLAAYHQAVQKAARHLAGIGEVIEREMFPLMSVTFDPDTGEVSEIKPVAGVQSCTGPDGTEWVKHPASQCCCPNSPGHEHHG